MHRIVLINCANTKKNYSCTAEEMYGDGRLFKKCLAYARTLVKDEDIYIATFVHGLVRLDERLDPYESGPPGSISVKQRRSSMLKVVGELAQRYNLADTEVVLLTSGTYSIILKDLLPHWLEPMSTLRMGERLAYLNSDVEPTVTPATYESTRDVLKRLEQKIDTIMEVLNG